MRRLEIEETGPAGPAGAPGSPAGFAKATATIDQVADLSGLGIGVKTFSKTILAPTANARLVSFVLGEGLFTKFDDGEAATYVVTLQDGATEVDSAPSDVSLATPETFPHVAGIGADYAFVAKSATTFTIKITSSADLNTATQGHVVVNLFYFVLA